jgi:MtN3 and saliva related transmembrane protein
MDYAMLFGSLAAIATTISFLPQAVKTFRTRDTRSLSLGMYSLFTFGVSCWLVYGILLGEWPIILANIVTLLLAVSILAMKVKHG